MKKWLFFQKKIGKKSDSSCYNIFICDLCENLQYVFSVTH